MLIKNIKLSGHQRNTKTLFSQKAHVSWFTAIHHLKAEIKSFKMVCNMSLGLFLTETKELPICVPFPQMEDVIKAIVGTLHDFTKPIQQQHLTPLLWPLIKIIMKSQEEESRTPDYSKINHLKQGSDQPNSNPYLIYVHPIVFFFKVPTQGRGREVRGWTAWGHRPHRELGRDLDHACI